MHRFPIPPTEQYRYRDEWTASHHGTDIFADRRTPVVAVGSGYATAKEDPKGGHTVTLRADDGWRYYYAHLDSYAPRLVGARGTAVQVAAGDLLGTVGNTGNAKATSPHLHFQMWAPDGKIKDPWAYLVAVDSQLGPPVEDLPVQPNIPPPPDFSAPSASATPEPWAAGAGLALLALLWGLTRRRRRG